MSITDDFAQLARELEAQGLSNGTEFRVETVPADGGMTGSEYVGLIRSKQDLSLFTRRRATMATPDAQFAPPT